MLGGAAAGLGEQAVGEVDDLGRGAVVADELDDCGSGVADAEVEKVVGSCTGERIDRLAGVTDDAEAVALAEPQFQESLLERADVLVLVDHEVLVLGADLLRDVVTVLEDRDRQQQDVLEVDDRSVALEVLVRPVQLGDLGRGAGDFAAGLGGGGRVVGGDGLGDLGPLDLRRDVPQFPRSRRMRQAAAASATSWILRSTSRGRLPPTAFGQKYWSWRSAAEWKVRAWTPPAPSWRRRPRISPAARLVKVTASTLEGCRIPARTP